MPKFSKLSEQRLATCDSRLQKLLRAAIEHVDFTVLCGYRNEEEQEDAFRRGASTKHYPDSRHNTLPSSAVDIAPYPVDWKDTARFARLVGYIERIAQEHGIRIRWGGDFDGDGYTVDEKFIDMPHIELVEP